MKKLAEVIDGNSGDAIIRFPLSNDLLWLDKHFFAYIAILRTAPEHIVDDKLFNTITNQRDLEELVINNSSISDDAFGGISELSGLTRLLFASENLTDVSLSRLEHRDLPNLRRFNLDAPNVKGKGLQFLASKQLVEEIIIRSRNFDDAGLVWLQPVESLKYLTLESKSFNGEGLRFISNLPRLSILVLKNTPVDDASLTHLEMLNLEELFLNSTDVTSSGLRSIASMETLHLLDLRGTTVDDRGLTYLDAHPSLANVNLIDTNVTKNGVEAFRSRNPQIIVHSNFE